MRMAAMTALVVSCLKISKPKYGRPPYAHAKDLLESTESVPVLGATMDDTTAPFSNSTCARQSCSHKLYPPYR
jgi:hypothetical protein